MPLPKPEKNEKQDEWISRCMRNPAAQKEFPKNKQRLAFCFSQWDRAKNKKKKEKRAETMPQENPPIEHRYFPMEVRTVDGKEDGKEQPVLQGHAAVFNRKSENMSPFDFLEFFEIIAPGAFSDVLDQDVRALINHKPGLVLGRTTNNTLQLREDEFGLLVRITPPDTVYAHDLVENIRIGNITQMSIGFRGVTDSVLTEPLGDGRERITRTIHKIHNLRDVSPVTFPAYPQTDIGVRDLFGEDFSAYIKRICARPRLERTKTILAGIERELAIEAE